MQKVWGPMSQYVQSSAVTLRIPFLEKNLVNGHSFASSNKNELSVYRIQRKTM